MQSDKILITQTYFFSNLYIRWKFSLMTLGNQSTKGRKNEAKIKNQSLFFKPTNNFRSLKNHQLITKKIPDKFGKKSA